MPRHRLRAMVPVVADMAKRHGCEYKSVSFWRANLELLATLRTTAQHTTKLHTS